MSITLIIQLLAPGALASLHPEKFDAASLICAPSGNLSDEAIAAAEEFSRLANENAPHEEFAGAGHCHFCISSCAGALPVFTTVHTPYIFIRSTPATFTLDIVHYRLTGPPLSGRGPPLAHNV